MMLPEMEFSPPEANALQVTLINMLQMNHGYEPAYVRLFQVPGAPCLQNPIT